MSRIDNTKKLRQTAIDEIYSDNKKLYDYLKFASGIYKYGFDDSLLIYKANPNATMLAELKIWNKVGRRINQNQNGIPVLDEAQEKLRYLFDITQTNGNLETVPKLWSLNNDNKEDFLAAYSDNTVEECLSSEVIQAISERAEQLEDIIEKNKLTQVQADELYQISEQIVGEIVLNRCTLNSDLELKQRDLNLPQIKTIIDKASFVTFCRTNNIAARTVLKGIENTITEINMKRRVEENDRNTNEENRERDGSLLQRRATEVSSENKDRERYRIHTERAGDVVLSESFTDIGRGRSGTFGETSGQIPTQTDYEEDFFMKAIKSGIKVNAMKVMAVSSAKSDEQNANFACVWWLGQSKQTKAVKKLKKF